VTPRASIVMAMHNAAPTVAQALQSLQSQTETSWEAIIVDDGSTDGCGSIVRTFAGADPRITLLRQTNAGAAAARNAGLDRCRGEYIGFLDADDWLEPAALEGLLGVAQSGDDGAVCGRWKLCDQDGRPVEWARQPAEHRAIGLKELVTGECFAIHAQLIRRSVIGGTRFSPDLDCYEDADFYFRLAERGVRWRPCDEVVCTYRQRPRNRGTPDHAAKFRTIQRVFTECFHRIGAHGLPRHGIDASRAALDRLLLERAFNYASTMLMQDPTPNKDLAASVLSSIDPCLQITPEMAARAAHNYLPWSESRSITEWQRHMDRYAQALGPWWLRCINDGRADVDLAERASPLLARLIANEQDIPDRLLSQIDPARPITLLGAGRNGRRMAQALSSRKLSFGIRDERPDKCAEIARISGGRARIVAPHERYDSRTQLVMTVLDDAAYFSSLPPGLCCVRWADQVETASRQICEQLQETAAPSAGSAPVG
jgi:glycosyltransferase involved in cell wall biosynthesis